MPYTAQQLITRSWYLSGIVGRGFQVPTGDQITDGLFLLNALLDFKQIETDLIPYYQYILMNATPGVENYFLPFVTEVESCTFNLGVVRYPMVSTSRRNYYGSSRVDNIETLPFSYNFDRALGGGNISLYFIPDQAYPLKMQVKIFLTNVTLLTDLTNITETTPYTFIHNSNQGFDTGYIEYLRYKLAQYMCSEFGVTFNPESAKTLKAMERTLMYESPPDLSMKKTTILTADQASGYSWADVNIGMGWRP